MTPPPKPNYAVIDMQLTEEILRFLDAQHYTLAAKRIVATMIAAHRLKYGADSIDGAR
jgi:hypothetical protein